MKKRKYITMGEVAQGYECTNKKCKWQGTDDQKGRKQISSYETSYVCPLCGKDEFYGLLNYDCVSKDSSSFKSEAVVFETGTYTKRCDLFHKIAIGSSSCVGHSKIELEPCLHYVDHKQDSSYYLEILKENIPIVSLVICKRPVFVG